MRRDIGSLANFVASVVEKVNRLLFCFFSLSSCASTTSPMNGGDLHSTRFQVMLPFLDFPSPPARPLLGRCFFGSAFFLAD